MKQNLSENKNIKYQRKRLSKLSSQNFKNIYSYKNLKLEKIISAKYRGQEFGEGPFLAEKSEEEK